VEGGDAVSVSLLKQCTTELAVVIANLANVSFKSGHFPRVMKHGIVAPHLKKPGLDVTDLKNFRPVTNLSTISKILERLALARLKPHISSSPNYHSLQSAYRQRHSTETAICKIVDDVIRCVDDGNQKKSNQNKIYIAP